VRFTTGVLDEAGAALEDGLRAARQAGVPDVEGHLLWGAGLLPHWRGDHARALQIWDEAVRTAREHQLPDILAGNLWTQGLGFCGGGDYERALERLRESLDLSTRLGEKFYRCRILNTLGWVYMDLCNWDLAIRYNAEGATESRAVGNPEIIRNAELNLGDCYLALGQLDEAQRYLETVQRESQQTVAWGEVWMKWRYTQHMNASLADLWLARGDPERAILFADACIDAAEATTSRRNIVKGRRVKGEALLAQGKLAEADAELQAALRVAEEVGNPAQLWKTLAALGRLRQAQDQADAAGYAYRRAIGIVETMAAGLSDAALRDTLLSSAQMAALRQAAPVF
jgi:tetratricopeptide (TPR) repeat protein